MSDHPELRTGAQGLAKGIAVDDVIATALLRERPPRFPDHAAECEALFSLSQSLASHPKPIAQRLVDIALDLTRAGSAGLSLEDVDGPEPQFRWVATAGEFSRYANGTMPRNFSPCQVTLDRDEAILMRDPARVYPYIAELHASVHEVLLVPFHLEGKPVGTLWLVSHSAQRLFDSEDLRVVRRLSDFAAVAVGTVGLVGRLQDAREQSARLREADRRKDDFLALIAHELRNPLSPIKHALELLRKRSGVDSYQGQLFDIIERQVDLLTGLVYDLTDAASIRSGKLALRRKQITVQEVVALAVEASRPLIDVRGHRLEVSQPEAPVHFEGDRGRLSQVLANLLNNAAKYTPDGGSITLRVEVDESLLQLEVADSGIGIAPELLPSIFEMFIQAPQNTIQPKGGLGIGLALVRQLVELHGGSVKAHSAGEGRGSQFIVCLPLQLPVPNSTLPGASIARKK